MKTPDNAYDHFVNSRAALWLAFAWGCAEATLFFIVPDVLLTLLACRAWRQAGRASLAACLGALLGGSLMFAAGTSHPAATHGWLLRVPAIQAELVTQVETQLAAHGLMSMLLGPLKGIPYKIYAATWGAQGGDWLSFFLYSMPARLPRLWLGVLAAHSLAWLLRHWTRRRAALEIAILSALWLGFYCFYFNRFGW